MIGEAARLGWKLLKLEARRWTVRRLRRLADWCLRSAIDAQLIADELERAGEPAEAPR